MPRDGRSRKRDAGGRDQGRLEEGASPHHGYLIVREESGGGDSIGYDRGEVAARGDRKPADGWYLPAMKLLPCPTRRLLTRAALASLTLLGVGGRVAGQVLPD